jgi:hypothetical protein
MRTDDYNFDPKTESMLERQSKLARHDKLQRQNAVLVAFLVGLVVGVLSEVLRR